MEGHPERSGKTISGSDPLSVATVPPQGLRVLWEESFPTSCANTGSACCIQQIISQPVQCGSYLSCRVTEKSCDLTSIFLWASGYSARPLGWSSPLCQTNCSSCRTFMENLPEGPSGVAEKGVGCLLVCLRPSPRASCWLWAPLNTEKFRFGCSPGSEGCWPLPSLQ